MGEIGTGEWKRVCGREVASYPGLLTPAFVACSTNVGEGLVKLSHVQGHTWACGGVAHSFCTALNWLSESKKRYQDCLMSSAQLFYGPCLQSVAHSLTPFLPGMCHSSTLPGTSLHVTQFYQAFPMLVLQATNAGVRRPGYEARREDEISSGDTLHV